MAESSRERDHDGQIAAADIIGCVAAASRATARIVVASIGVGCVAASIGVGCIAASFGADCITAYIGVDCAAAGTAAAQLGV